MAHDLKRSWIRINWVNSDGSLMRKRQYRRFRLLGNSMNMSVNQRQSSSASSRSSTPDASASRPQASSRAPAATQAPRQSGNVFERLGQHWRQPVTKRQLESAIRHGDVTNLKVMDQTLQNFHGDANAFRQMVDKHELLPNGLLRLYRLHEEKRFADEYKAAQSINHLLQVGVDPGKGGFNKQSAMFTAMLNRHTHPKMLEAVMDAADRRGDGQAYREPDVRGLTPLHLLVKYYRPSDTGVLDRMLRSGANPHARYNNESVDQYINKLRTELRIPHVVVDYDLAVLNANAIRR